MPRLTAQEVRAPMIEGAVKGIRSLGHRDATRKTIFTDPVHKAVFRRMLQEMVDSPETDEAGEAAAGLLKELGPGGFDD